MKKFIIGIIIGVIIASSFAIAASYVAEPASFKVLVNGKEFTSEPPVMVINGSTYLPLRAMGDALGVPVNWNSELRQAEVGNTPTKFNKFDVDNFINGEIWNNGFWFIREYITGGLEEYYMDMYISTFASSADEKIDINKIIKRVIDTKPTVELYNNEFKANEKWIAFYNEYNRLYELVQNNKFNKTNFDTTFFEKVRDEFCEELYK